MIVTAVYLAAALANLASAQNYQVQTDTWNSNFSLTAAQITAANLTAFQAHNYEVALNYERTNYADGPGGVASDPFYDIPASFDPANPPAPGTILKMEEFTDTTNYTIPPSLTLSRFIYTTETLNGTSIPASAYILWPYTPRSFGSGHYGGSPLQSCSGKAPTAAKPVFPLVGFAHGTSGQTPNCAPSHQRTLYDEFHEPFPLALSGYAVVAPDYAGLGVSGIVSPYFVLPAQANDLFHAIAAAQSAFPDTLSKNFVLVGQSQGGGVAWAAAQRQAVRPVAGYLGTVAASPFGNVLADIVGESVVQQNIRIIGIAQGLASVLPDFQISDWITPTAIARRRLLVDTGGCGVAAGALSNDGVALVYPNWNQTAAARWYQNETTNGGRPFAPPMLVIQGDQDGNAIYTATETAVSLTCSMYPQDSLHYIEYANITHVPVLYAGQHVWLDWVRDRFAGVQLPRGCVKEAATPARGVANGAGQNWFIEKDVYGL